MSPFADDTRLLKQIQIADDQEQRQRDLNKLYEWARNRKMELNSDIFTRIIYDGRHNGDIAEAHY